MLFEWVCVCVFVPIDWSKYNAAAIQTYIYTLMTGTRDDTRLIAIIMICKLMNEQARIDIVFDTNAWHHWTE